MAKIEDYEEASKYFDKAIQLDPNNIQAWIIKANALTELGNEEEASLSFERVRTIDPNYQYYQVFSCKMPLYKSTDLFCLP